MFNQKNLHNVTFFMYIHSMVQYDVKMDDDNLLP